MSSTYKILGQISPQARTNAVLYTAPTDKAVVCSTLSICNCGTSTTVRVAVVKNGTIMSNANYIVYDCTVDQHDTIFLTIGVTLSASDYMMVYAESAGVAFGLFGSEVG